MRDSTPFLGVFYPSLEVQGDEDELLVVYILNALNKNSKMKHVESQLRLCNVLSECYDSYLVYKDSVNK